MTNPNKSIREYDKRFDVFWDEVIKILNEGRSGNRFDGLRFTDKFVKRHDPYGYFDAGYDENPTPMGFVIFMAGNALTWDAARIDSILIKGR